MHACVDIWRLYNIFWRMDQRVMLAHLMESGACKKLIIWVAGANSI